MYTWSKYLRILTIRIIHTSDWKCDSPFESYGEEAWLCLGCLPIKHDVCCLRFLCMCSARYYRWKWLEGHTSSVPQKYDSEVKYIHTQISLRDLREFVTGRTPLYRDLRCAFQITFCDVIWHTHGLFCSILNFNSWNAHLELKFKIRTLPSCENSQCYSGKCFKFNKVRMSLLSSVFAGFFSSTSPPWWRKRWSWISGEYDHIWCIHEDFSHSIKFWEDFNLQNLPPPSLQNERQTFNFCACVCEIVKLIVISVVSTAL